MRNLEILAFLQKHRIFLYANALWKYNKKIGASTIIWPQDNTKIRIWHNDKERNLIIKNKY